MKKILVTWVLTKEQKEMLECCFPEAEFCYTDGGPVTGAMASDAAAILGNVEPEVLKHAEKLEWLQLHSAGANQQCEPGVLGEKVILTNASGAYGLSISEHMLGMLLMLQKKLVKYYENQRNHIWKDEGMVTGICGSTTLVLGMGNLGCEFARKMKAMGSHVIGLRRTEKPKPDFFDEQFLTEQLEDLLPKADIVAVCLPETGATRNMFDEKRLSLMKNNAILINVGRGGLVDHLALARLLTEQRIGGAALDVTEPEPLPEDHPLWSAPNVLITPHVSGGCHMEQNFEIILKITAENLKAFRDGRPLKNQVDRTAGY